MILTLACSVTSTAGSAQRPASASDALATVQITQPVLANGKPLPADTYELRLTNEWLAPLAGQSSSAERWVELVANGSVVAREVAVVLRDDDRPTVGASAEKAAEGTRVQMPKGGEFLRLSVKRGNERFLVHFPVPR
jgi:hypothetical protein